MFYFVALIQHSIEIRMFKMRIKLLNNYEICTTHKICDQQFYVTS